MLYHTVLYKTINLLQYLRQLWVQLICTNNIIYFVSGLQTLEIETSTFTIEDPRQTGLLIYSIKNLLLVFLFFV